MICGRNVSALHVIYIAALVQQYADCIYARCEKHYFSKISVRWKLLLLRLRVCKTNLTKRDIIVLLLLNL